jgi:ESX secretion system ATPase EccB
VPSRTDQLQSYQFRTRRVLSALVMRETDPAQSPLRRGVGAVFAGMMITVLAMAAFGIYGLFAKVSGDGWRTPGSIVIERETGATFVYLNDTLYPTLNLASAMLAAGQPNPTVHRVASNSLTDVARANPIGIPGAPDSLPPADRQIGLPWTVCALTETDGANNRVARVALAVGVPASGGEPVGDDDALLVRDATLGTTFLVWHGRRHLVQSSRTVVPALFGAAAQTDVASAWLNALPAGTDIEPTRVNDPGRRSTAMPEFNNGDVLLIQTASGPQHYLVFDDGLAPLTPLQLDVLNAVDPVEPIEVEPVTVADAPDSRGMPDRRETDPPTTTPRLVTPDASARICATTRTDSAPPSIETGGTVDGIERAIPTRGASIDGTPLANRILVPAGRVSVLRAITAPASPAGPYLVVTDLGIAYPLPDAQVLPLLGYSPSQAADVPAQLVSLIPLGPALDPAAATQPVAPLT